MIYRSPTSHSLADSFRLKSSGEERCQYVYLGNIIVLDLGATGIGIHLEQTGGDTIYFTTISNCVVSGGNANDWQQKMGIKLSADDSIIVGTRIFGGRFFRLLRGHSLENCDTTKVYGAAFDDSGRAVYLDFAGKCEYIGCRFEGHTFDKVLEFTSNSADNIIGEIPQDVAESDIIDQGIRNGWYGSDGSKGLFNKLPRRTPIESWKTKNFEVTEEAQIQTANIGKLSVNRNLPSQPDLVAETLCDLGGTESGTGPGGSLVMHRFNFPYQVSAIYLAIMTGVSNSDVQHYAHYVSIFTEITPGQFLETNLVDKKNVITESSIELSRNADYIEMKVATGGGIPGETVSVKRNLIRLA